MSNEQVMRFRPYYFDPVAQTGHMATMRANSGGDYVRWEDFERLLNILKRLTSATEDTLNEHAKELECCCATRLHCNEAKAYLTALEQSRG
jgi:hypothetical protein